MLSSVKFPRWQHFFPCALDNPVNCCAPVTRWLRFTANEMLSQCAIVKYFETLVDE